MPVEITSVVGSKETGAKLQQLIVQCQSFAWASAWITPNEAFQAAIKAKAKLESLVIGTHMYITDPACLQMCVDIPQAKVLLPDSGPLFHAKLYAFRHEKKVTIYVGSANCTNAGLNKNIEAGVFLSGDHLNPNLQSFFTFIKQQAARALDINDPLIESYTANKKLNQDALDGLDNFTWVKKPRHIASSSLLNDLNGTEWKQFVQLVRKDDAKDMRLELLARARQLFASVRTLQDFTVTEQQCVTGLLQPTELNGVDWGYFGQMSAHGSFKRVLREHAPLLSQALDKIPLVGPVKRRHYEAFVEIFQRIPTARATWIGFGTRLLAIKRPDYFVCICNPNKRQLADVFATSFSTFNLHNYWDRVVAPMQLMPWWQEEMPSEGFEQQLWMGRAAMLDAICYDPSMR
ncbi:MULTISPECIES: phospholipase D family protein [unclassified Pseudomonas]|uniref:phospholipase D family protein n=1 Tax=unclassified Pseudomonas TaxID=196821 RepID=UPI00244A73EA|nr:MULTISPECIES: phospholipase D family protein [unclassified Pseudomonas]MDH0302436.1 phospholipase D family protein [Pseudomonas sp. GD04091]MDH1985680.1 phospholipase D family protein [Pseudomonas sp. GD03689]